MNAEVKELVLTAWKCFSKEKPKKILNFPAGYKNNLYMLFVGDEYYILTIYKPNIFTNEEISLRCQIENTLKQNGINVIPPIKGFNGKFLQLFSSGNKEFQTKATKYNELVLVNENKVPTVKIVEEMARHLRDLHSKLKIIKDELPFKTFDIEAKLTEMSDTKTIFAIRDYFKDNNFSTLPDEGQLIEDYTGEIDFLKKYFEKRDVFKTKQPIHADYQLSNLLIHNEKISAIFDFDEILLAPVLYEIAITLLYTDVIYFQPTELLFSNFLKHYYNKNGIDEKTVKDLIVLLRYRCVYKIYRWFVYKRFLKVASQAKHYGCFYERLNYYKQIKASDILKLL